MFNPEKFTDNKGELNQEMDKNREKIEKAIQEIKEAVKDIKDPRLLFVGIAYKENTDDMRSSNVLKIIHELMEDGFQHIDYNDPYIPHINQTAFSIPINEKILTNYDATIIGTRHEDLDLDFLKKYSKIFVDISNIITE